MMPLDESTVLVAAEAFDHEVRARIDRLFDRALEVPSEEALTHLAGNAVALPDGRVLLTAGAKRTAALLAESGYEPVPVEASEFLKSGGSLFCMKQWLW